MGNYYEVRDIVLEDLKMQRKLALIGKDNPLNVPFIMAPQGVGKTRLAEWLAAHFGIGMCVLNFGENSSSVEATGLPNLMSPGMFENPFSPHPDDGEQSDHSRIQNATFTRWSLNEAIEHAIQFPTFLFIDDADKGPRALQAALLALTGERTVRDRKLHPETLIMLAGNRVGDDVLANEISESLLTRTTPVVLDYSYDDFERYTIDSEKIHPTVLAFCARHTELIHNKPKDKTEDFRFPTPRCWEEASHHLFEIDKLNIERSDKNLRASRVITRKLGKAVASTWDAWVEVLSKIDIDVLFQKGRMTNAEDHDDVAYASVAAAVLLATEARKHGHDVVDKIPGLPKFFEEDSGIPQESKVVCFSMLNDVLRSALATSSTTVNFVPLYAGIGLED